MRKIMILTHGRMASGLYDTLKMFVGEQEGIQVIDAYVDGSDSFLDEIDRFLGSIESNDEAVVFTDLYGGSVNQIVMKRLIALNNPNIYLISQVNLAVIISVVMHFEVLSKDTIDQLILESQVQNVEIKFEKVDVSNEDDFF